MGEPKFKINGQDVNAPRNWNDIEILATFDNSSVQANITTDKFNFVNETAQIIREYIEGGGQNPPTTLGIFEGMPFEIEISESNAIGVPLTNIFRGLIDTTKFTEVAPNEVEIEIKDQKGLDRLEFKAEGLTFGLMVEKGHITELDYVDIPYLVQKPRDPLALALLYLSIFQLTIQLAEALDKFQEYFQDALAHLTGGATGGVASAVWSVARALTTLIYLGILIVQIIQLIDKLIEYLLPQVKYFKGMKLRTLLEKGATFMDYTFQSSIPELDNYYILPSKEKQGTNLPFLNPPNNDTGEPRTGDQGYIYVELLEIAKNMFKAKYLVDENNVITLEPLNNNAFWLQQSTYQISNVLRETFSYNTEELSATKVVSFNTDIQDQWLLDRFTGTVYEIKTEPSTVGTEQNVLIGGYNETAIPYALGTRKDDLTEVEQAFYVLLDVLDQGFGTLVNIQNFFIGLVGGTPSTPPNYSNIITGKIGYLRISEDLINVPKILYLTLQASGVQGNQLELKIPENHRDELSARALWEKYLNEESFVDLNYRNQWKIYQNIEVPFTLVDFLSLIQNSYFYDTDGSEAKVDKISWKIGDDKAVIDYRKRNVYTRNLIETKIEP